MQEKFILSGGLVLLLLPRRYTVMVSFESLHSGTFSLFPLHHCLTVRVYVCTGGCLLSVAVVKNSSLDISSLQGLRSCHSGIRWTAGWNLPLGFLLSRNYLSWSKQQPLSHGSNIGVPYVCIYQFSLRFKDLRVFSSFRVYPLGQTSVVFLEPAAFLVPLPWHHHCALCARVKSPTVSRRITTAKRLTASLSTAAKGPSGQGQLIVHIWV